MKLWFMIVKKLAEICLTYVYNYIDSDDNGEISQREIMEFSKMIKTIVKGGLKK